MPVPKEVISLSFSDSLCGPSCVQCRSPMTLALCEPDFENPTLMLATYRCAKCGLRERAKIEAEQASAVAAGNPNATEQEIAAPTEISPDQPTVSRTSGTSA